LPLNSAGIVRFFAQYATVASLRSAIAARQPWCVLQHCARAALRALRLRQQALMLRRGAGAILPSKAIFARRVRTSG